MNTQELTALVNELVKLPAESEWLEFKNNFHSPEEIGERISALSNGACLQKQSYGYLIFGVQDKTQQIIGTTFKAKSHKKGNEDLEHWLATRLNPRIDFEVYEFDYDESRHISFYIIPAAKTQPINFLHTAYIRVGSITRKLNDFPEKGYPRKAGQFKVKPCGLSLLTWMAFYVTISVSCRGNPLRLPC